MVFVHIIILSIGLVWSVLPVNSRPDFFYSPYDVVAMFYLGIKVIGVVYLFAYIIYSVVKKVPYKNVAIVAVSTFLLLGIEYFVLSYWLNTVPYYVSDMGPVVTPN